METEMGQLTTFAAAAIWFVTIEPVEREMARVLVLHCMAKANVPFDQALVIVHEAYQNAKPVSAEHLLPFDPSKSH